MLLAVFLAGCHLHNEMLSAVKHFKFDCAACQTCGWTVCVGRTLSENEFNATHVTSLCRKGILTDLLPPADQSLAKPTVNTALSTSSKRFSFVSNLRAINHCRDAFQQEKVCIT